MKIFAACPECGCTDWIRFDSGGFVCNGCGRLIFTEDIGVLLTEWEGKVSVILCNNATESVEIDLQQALPEGYNYTLKGSLNVGDQQEKLENNKLELPAYGIVILKQSGVD